ncbi:nicotianamine synthase family protein [Antribacter gilvus]|uniref:nicotianamine synthase family protein n=1 Tax=Antribacter gilvus TaxID=2304675 RepID=UPI000F7B1B17|nr:nicotianamine synthase family protein [Antribacter gilvus]
MNLIPATDPSAFARTTAGAVAEHLADLADRLEARPSLTPAPEVDALFGDLVRTVVRTPAATARAVLADPRVQRRAASLRASSARGESALEQAWARRITAAADPRAELRAFPYADNYRRLVRLELAALAPHHHEPVRSVAVLGSGPLPLTAFAYADRLSAEVVGVDVDPVATEAARRVATLSGPGGVRLEVGDAADVDLRAHDVVVLAALVGTTTAEKATLAARLATRMRPGALLLLRSARGLRTLLYPAVRTSTLRGFTVLEVVHPTDDVINSVVVARAGSPRERLWA